MNALLICVTLPVLLFSVSTNAFTLRRLRNTTTPSDEEPNLNTESLFPSINWPRIYQQEDNSTDPNPLVPWKAIEDLEKRILASIPRIRPSYIGSIDNFENNSFFKGIDPSKVKNETKHIKKIVDGHVIETNEQSIEGGDNTNKRVFLSKSVIIYPKNQHNVGSVDTEKDKTTPSIGKPDEISPDSDQDKYTPNLATDKTTTDDHRDDLNFRSVGSYPTTAEVDVGVPANKDVEFVKMSAYENPNELKEVDNTITIDEGEPIVYDLSRDVDVNKYVSSATVDPDAELINKKYRIAHNWNNDDKNFDTYRRYTYHSL